MSKYFFVYSLINIPKAYILSVANLSKAYSLSIVSPSKTCILSVEFLLFSLANFSKPCILTIQVFLEIFIHQILIFDRVIKPFLKDKI